MYLIFSSNIGSSWGSSSRRYDGKYMRLDGSTGEDLVQASGKLAVLDRLLTQLYAGGHRVVLFSQFKMMLDIFEDMMQMRGYVRMTRSSSHITTHVPSFATHWDSWVSTTSLVFRSSSKQIPTCLR